MSHGLKKGFIGMMWMACTAVILRLQSVSRGGNFRLQSVSCGGTCRAAAGGTGADGFRRTGRSGCGLWGTGGNRSANCFPFWRTWNQQTCSPCRMSRRRMHIHPFILKIPKAVFTRFSITKRKARIMWSSPTRGSTSRPQPLASFWTVC